MKLSNLMALSYASGALRPGWPRGMLSTPPRSQRLRLLPTLLAVWLALVWVETAQASETGVNGLFGPITKADRIVVRKMDRELLLLRDGFVIQRFRVALGRNPYGAKFYEGDGRTPEGVYLIDGRNEDSRFYKSLHISYPNEIDLARAAFHEVSAGGAIVIHGLPPEMAFIGSSHSRLDWTEGCIAVTNEEMDVLWTAIDDGTVIEILP